MIASGLLAVIVPSFHSVISLVGCLAGSTLTFIIPSLIDIYIFRRRGFLLTLDLVLITCGVVGAITGNIMSIQSF